MSPTQAFLCDFLFETVTLSCVATVAFRYLPSMHAMRKDITLVRSAEHTLSFFLVSATRTAAALAALRGPRVLFLQVAGEGSIYLSDGGLRTRASVGN